VGFILRTRRSRRLALAAVAAALLLLPAFARAQEPVRSFDELDTRLKPGDTIWVTDVQGREIAGKIRSLDATGLTLSQDTGGRRDARFLRVYRAADVRTVHHEPHDSLREGAAVGLAAGAVLTAAACRNTHGGEVALCAVLIGPMVGGLSTLAGLAVDAMIPGPRQLVYRAPSAAGSAGLSFAPIVTPRAKGVIVSFSF
jgi:hypothetical protein